MYNVSIPEITQDELKKRYERIKPIVEIEGVKYYLRDFTPEELTSTSYTWNANEDKREKVDMSLLVARNTDFECIHKYGYYGVFNPSIAEVLAQISDLDLEFTDAFEIIKSPQTSDDFKANKIVFNNHFHISTVRLYTSRTNPKVIFG